MPGEMSIQFDFFELFEDAAAPMLLQREGTIVMINDAMLRMLGYERADELLNQPVLNVVHPDDHDKVAIRIDQLKAGQIDPYPAETRWVQRDGQTIDVRVRASAVTIDGKPGSYVLADDIREERRIRRALHDREEVYRHAASVTSDAIWDWNLRTGVLTWSGRTSKLFRYDPDGITNDVKWWYQRVHPEDREAAMASLERAIDSDAVEWSEQYRFICGDGTIANVVDRGRIIRNEHGQAVRMIGTMSDVTEQSRAEAQIRQSEARYRLLVEQSPVPIFVDGKGTIAFANQAMATLLGAPSPEDLIGEATLAHIHPDEHDLVLPRIRTLYDQRKPLPAEVVKWVRRDGGAIDVVVTATPIVFDGREAAQVVARDITEEKRMQDALRNSEMLYRSVAGVTSDAVWDWDLIANEIHWAEGMYKLFGYATDQIDTSVDWWVQRLHPDDRERVVKSNMRVIESGEDVWMEEYRFRCADGSYAIVLDKGQVLRDDQGKGYRMVGAMTDVTAQREAEEEVRRLNLSLERRVVERTLDLQAANRELEAFSYSVSHDLRTPLRAIDGFSRTLQEDFWELLDARGRDYLDRIRAASQRMARLIDDMLELARVSRMELKREHCDLSAIAADCVADLRRAEPDREVEVVIEPNLVAMADCKQIRVVLQNLLGNAWKFTAHVSGACVRFAADTQQGTTSYRVTDNGAGFDMRYSGKLFKTFERLHSHSEFPGTGIGLATVQRIIQRHGGRVWAHGEVDRGATFYFTLQ